MVTRARSYVSKTPRARGVGVPEWVQVRGCLSGQGEGRGRARLGLGLQELLKGCVWAVGREDTPRFLS